MAPCPWLYGLQASKMCSGIMGFLVSHQFLSPLALYCTRSLSSRRLGAGWTWERQVKAWGFIKHRINFTKLIKTMKWNSRNALQEHPNLNGFLFFTCLCSFLYNVILTLPEHWNPHFMSWRLVLFLVLYLRYKMILSDFRIYFTVATIYINFFERLLWGKTGSCSSAA